MFKLQDLVKIHSHFSISRFQGEIARCKYKDYRTTDCIAQFFKNIGSPHSIKGGNLAYHSFYANNDFISVNKRENI
jgi:hypothetical protein